MESLAGPVGWSIGRDLSLTLSLNLGASVGAGAVYLAGPNVSAFFLDADSQEPPS